MFKKSIIVLLMLISYSVGSADMLKLKAKDRLILFHVINDNYIADIDFNNTTRDEFSLDSEFLYGLIEQAWEDHGQYNPEESVVYQFEIPVVISFNSR